MRFKSNLGQVRLTLHFDDDVSETFSVTPLQAAIIAQFDEPEDGKGPSKSVTADLIASTLQIPLETAKKELNFWVSHGVIRESELQKVYDDGYMEEQIIIKEIVYYASKTLDRGHKRPNATDISAG